MLGKTKKVSIDGSEMDYVVFGNGETPLVMIPGLSDGLKTVKGQGFTLASYYKEYAKDFKVYIFSRKNQLQESYTTRDMARDQKAAMDILGLKEVYLMGISQGGMISQYIAIDYPQLVKGLVLGVTVSRPNATLQRVVDSWIEMAHREDYSSLIIDTMERTFTEEGLKKYKKLYPIISRIGRPESFERFIIQAKACLGHNAYEELNKIKAPTLIIGGDSDRVAGENSSEEMVERIENSRLLLYKGLGHGAYEEAKDFNSQVIAFFQQ